jgi:hypothetical protein
LISGTSLFVGRLGGGEGRLPTREVLASAALEMVFRRPPFKIGIALMFSPLATAAVRAATLGPGFVTDLRRVTRWFALSEEERREWELFRAWDWRPGMAAAEGLETEGR